MNYTANLLPFELLAGPGLLPTGPAAGPIRLAEVIPFRSYTLPTPRQLASEVPFFVLAPSPFSEPRGAA